MTGFCREEGFVYTKETVSSIHTEEYKNNKRIDSLYWVYINSTSLPI